MSQSPPASLLRLREADVVRLCGLEEAARGLELVTQRAVRAGRRTDGRLEAAIEDGGTVHVWWEYAAAGGLHAARWHCDRHVNEAQAPPPEQPLPAPLGCSHVAALLTAWIRSPTDFAAPPSTAEGHTSGGTMQVVPRLTQPALFTAPRPWHAGRTLSDELERLSAAEIAAVSRRVLGAEPDERETRAALAQYLSEPASLAAHVGRLDAGLRHLLAELGLLGGVVTATDLDGLAARTGQAPSALHADAQTLARNGLLFPVVGGGGVTSAYPSNKHSWRQVTGWHLPAEIRDALRLELPIAPAPTRGTHGPPILAPSSSEAAAQERARRLRLLPGSPWLLCQALALFARAPAPYNPLVSTSAPAHSVRSASRPERAPPAAMVLGDFPQGTLVPMARAAGVPVGLASMTRRLLLWARERGVALDPTTVLQWEWPVILRLAFDLWRAAEVPFELADLSLYSHIRVGWDPVHPALRPAAIAAEVRDGRAFLLRVLAAARPGAWYLVEELLDLLWRLDPLFLRGRQRTYSTPAWWLERAGSRRPLRPAVREEWAAGEGEYVQALLAGPLHWFGALDLARDAAQGSLTAVRITPLGGYLLSGDEARKMTSSLGPKERWRPGPPALLTRDGSISVQPLVAGAVLLNALQLWACVRGVAGGRLVYALAPDRIAAAFDAGQTSAGLIAALRALPGVASARAAETLGRQLEERRVSYGASRIQTGWTLVEAQDEVALVEALAAAPEVARRALRPTPSLALVSPEDAAALQAALRRRGYTL